MEVYEPAEDSFLMADTIKEYLKNIKNKNIKILDMGSGTGIQAETCKNLGFKDFLCADINPSAIKLLKKKKFKAIKSNLFSKISSSKKFDLIIFNPPYLPEDNREPKSLALATTAGKKGYELILKFLKSAKSHLTKEGKIFLLFSTLSNPDVILAQASKDYKFKLVSQKMLFFEGLFVYELKKK